MDHTPKPFILLAGLVVLLVLSAFIPAKWLGVKPVKSGYEPVDFTKLTTYADDTDGNGKISWRELVTTSEIGAQTLAESGNVLPDSEAVELLNDPNNLSSSFTKNLYIADAYLSKSGITDAESQQKVLDQLVQEEANKLVSKTYVYADIRVAKTETIQSVRDYGNKVASIMKGMITLDSIEKDSNGLMNFMNTGDKAAVAPLVQDYQAMDTRITQMATLTIPPSATAYHLIALNQMTKYRDTLYNMSQAPTDLLRTNLVFKGYPNVTVETLTLYDQFSKYFDLKNIVYARNDPGYVFTVGYTLK